MAAALMAVAASLTACSNDETIEQQQQPTIGFNPLVNRSTITRGLSVESAADVKSFDVWAYSNAGAANEALYMGYAKDGVQIRQGFEVGTLGAFTGTNNTVWGYDKSGELAYWPSSDMLQFVALSPAHDYDDATETAAASETDVNYTFTNDTHDFASTGKLGFTYTADNTAPTETKINTQLRDILAAANYQNYNVEDGVGANGNVPLKFRHLLSKIELQGQINRLNKNIKVEISEIAIHNIIKTGTCKLTVAPTGTTFLQDNFATTNPIVWTTIPGDENVNYVTYTITPKDATDNTLPVTLKYTDEEIAAATTPDENSTAVSLHNTGDNLFLIPQTITAWDHDNATAASRTITQADTDHTVYLAIKAKITQNGIYILGSADSYGITYAPLPTPDNQWKPGSKYLYTLIFGIGEDASGDNIGRPITFSCSVTSWTSEDTQTIEM